MTGNYEAQALAEKARAEVVALAKNARDEAIATVKNAWDEAKEMVCGKCGKPKETRRMVLVNRTAFKSKDLKEIAGALLEGQLAPSFYLIVQTPKHDGLTITNLDMPAMIIIPKDLHCFAKVFAHELVHLQQHSKNYVDEEEAYRKEREVVVSE